MSVVVGCLACGKISQVPPARAGLVCMCGGSRALLLTVSDNRERWTRGIPLDEWFDAPDTPGSRAECEDGDRPCPFLRCRYHLGNPGDRGCALDVADSGGHTLSQTGRILAITPGRVLQIEIAAKERASNDNRATHRPEGRRDRSADG